MELSYLLCSISNFMLHFFKKGEGKEKRRQEVEDKDAIPVGPRHCKAGKLVTLVL